MQSPEVLAQFDNDVAERFRLRPEAVENRVVSRVMLGELPPSALAEAVVAVLRHLPTMLLTEAIHRG